MSLIFLFTVQLTWAAHPGRRTTWSILCVLFNQSTATSLVREFPAGTLTKMQELKIFSNLFLEQLDDEMHMTIFQIFQVATLDLSLK